MYVWSEMSWCFVSVQILCSIQWVHQLHSLSSIEEGKEREGEERAGHYYFIFWHRPAKTVTGCSPQTNLPETLWNKIQNGTAPALPKQSHMPWQKHCYVRISGNWIKKKWTGRLSPSMASRQHMQIANQISTCPKQEWFLHRLIKPWPEVQDSSLEQVLCETSYCSCCQSRLFKLSGFGLFPRVSEFPCRTFPIPRVAPVMMATCQDTLLKGRRSDVAICPSGNQDESTPPHGIITESFKMCFEQNE